MNKNNDLILAIDVGTQSIRAGLIDLKGNIDETVRTPIEPYFSVHPGWTEQHPDYFWKMLCTTCNKLLGSSKHGKEAIKGVALTSQRNTIVNLDKSGKPLRPAIVWLDQRKARLEKYPPPPLKLLFKAAKVLNTVEKAIKSCQASWIRQNQSEIWKKTHKYLFLSGYLNYMLTGEYIESAGNIVGYVPFDGKAHEWANKSDLKWKLFPMDKSILPKLVKPTQLLGYITEKAADESGIPKGLPLFAAGTDKSCEVLGSGCLSPEIACLSYGTTATLETTSKKYIEIIPMIAPFPSAVPGAYNTEIMIYRGYWMLSWFKKEFGQAYEQIAKEKNISAEVLIDEIAEKIPAGSQGLVLHPYWSPGLDTAPYVKGAIIGFGDVHTRAHIYRAILEGLTYALKKGATTTEKKTRVKIKKLRVSGGGSQSKLALQITADIFGLPAERPHVFEASMLGAGIDAAVGLKLYPDFNSAVSGMTRIRDVFHPIPENRDRYQELFEKVYLKIYEKLLPLYYNIMNITGYPSE